MEPESFFRGNNVSGSLRTSILSALALTAMWLPLAGARADVTVFGPADSVHVLAKDSTVRDALQAVAKTYNVELHDAENLTEPLSGSYKGNLQSVLGEIMGSRGHVIRPKDGSLALFVLDGAQANSPDAGSQAQSSDPVRAAVEAKGHVPLSPEAQELAVKMFGEKGRNLQVNEGLLRSFYKGRGGRRYVGQPAQ